MLRDIMFIPYHSNGGHINVGSKNLNMLQPASTVGALSPNMSGNIGLQTNPLEASIFYNTLAQSATQDPFWSLNDSECSVSESLHNTKIIEKGRCLHCKHWVGDKGADLVQIQHVLNGCKSFKMQGRYHWRHEAVLNYIGSLLEKKGASGTAETEIGIGSDWTAFRCYIDVQGRRTHDDGTVPDQLLVTSAKPDIFILDQRDHLTRPEVIIIDLTIPWDGRVDAARSEKLAKFSQLVATIKGNDAFNVTYQSFEIGSFRQRLSDGSESAMKLLYNYITPKMTFDAFRCNLIDLVNYSSYHIFATRNETKWDNATIYPVPNMPESSTTDPEPLYENVPSVTKLVEEMAKNVDQEIVKNDSEMVKNDPEMVKSEERLSLDNFNLDGLALNADTSIEEVSKEDKSIEESKEIIIEKTSTAETYEQSKTETEIIQNTMETVVSKTSVTKLVEPSTSEDTEELFSKSSNSSPDAAKDTKITMTIYQLLAILLIFCLIMLILNIMWNNLFTTMLICCITLPILRWLGKV